MQKPKVVMFDYGQTIINELSYDGAKGYDALLRHAACNPQGVTGEQLRQDMEELNAELGRFNPATRHLRLTEIPECEINRYICARRGVTFDCDLQELEIELWDAANPCEPCEGIAEFLAYLKSEGIGTGVVSNLSFCSETLRKRVNRCIPSAEFDFIISSCDYVFRKPSPHIYEVALAKAGVAAEEAWFCGDQYQADLVGAMSVGIMPVWYKGNLRYDAGCVMPQGAGLEVESWQELQTIMQSLN